jgi:hypothetical protein
MKVFKGILIFVLLSAGIVFAAEAPKTQEEFEVETMAPPAPMATEGLPSHNFLFISADLEDGGKVVQGAPYSATAVTERVQNLADGNRIVNKTTTKIFRDSQGRTRREQELGAIGNWKASEEPNKMIFIQDPVAKVHYVLEPENMVARKMNFDEKPAAPPIPPAHGESIEVRAPHPPLPPGQLHTQVFRYEMSDKDAKKESLGTQMMEGLRVDGTRTTVTIPAGEMGNEMPIKVVSEQWYSPDLQINLMTKHSDPRFGDTVYRLTDISRTEQNRSLFEVPQGYRIEKASRAPIIIRHQDKTH